MSRSQIVAAHGAIQASGHGRRCSRRFQHGRRLRRGRSDPTAPVLSACADACLAFLILAIIVVAQPPPPTCSTVSSCTRQPAGRAPAHAAGAAQPHRVPRMEGRLRGAAAVGARRRARYSYTLGAAACLRPRGWMQKEGESEGGSGDSGACGCAERPIVIIGPRQGD